MEKEFKMLRDEVAKLAEHFDTVQVFVSKYESGFTHSFSVGEGNFNARQGQVKNWVIRQEQAEKDQQILEDETEE